MDFNPLQKEAIDDIFGTKLIMAPVGTGKTTVLTERVLKAIEAGIAPDRILNLTFTNRAGEEIRSRIISRLSSLETANAVTTKTFHAFCAYFIKAEADSLGLDPDFIIWDEHDQAEAFRKVMEDRQLPYFTQLPKKEIAGLLETIYRHRLRQLENDIGCRLSVPPLTRDQEIAAHGYREEMEAQNALDFNELVLITLRELYADSEVSQRWKQRYDFIQLDEFQDTHLSEYLIIKELAKRSKNLAVIGDIDQTIYSWRGSEPYFLVELMKSHFHDVKTYQLEENFRSDRYLIEASRSFLDNLQKRATGKIYGQGSYSDSPCCVDVFAAHDLNEEVDYIIERIRLIREVEPGSRIAVLTRTNSLISRIASIFEERQISHITVDKYDFFRRQEVKDTLAHLRIIFNKYDWDSALRIVARPPKQIGDQTIAKIRHEGEAVGLRLADFFDMRNLSFEEPFSNLIDRHQKGRLVVLDTETTGTDPVHDEIIQIYAIEIINGQPGREFHRYLRNTKPIGLSGRIHGLTDEFLHKNGEDPQTVLAELIRFIGHDPIIGHNINFDRQMIEENCRRRQLDYTAKEYYDTLDIAKRFITAENYKLNTLSKLLGLSTATHDAKDDVLATVQLLGVLISRLLVEQAKRAKIYGEIHPRFIAIANKIFSWKIKAGTTAPSALLNTVWEQSGLKEYYESDKDSEKRLKSYDTLQRLFAESEKNNPASHPSSRLKELIHFAALAKDLNFLGLEKGQIPIVTVHQVKGLEFDHVFIAGFNEKIFPSGLSEIEEEKRLFYVALTRAKKRVYLSYSRFNDHGYSMSPSHFIGLIDGKYLHRFD